jgi:hypothetical protein
MSAYFLGHIVNAADSSLDMRRSFFGPFFSNPPGPGRIILLFFDF